MLLPLLLCLNLLLWMKIETLTLRVTRLLAVIARSVVTTKMISMASPFADGTIESSRGVAARVS